MKGLRISLTAAAVAVFLVLLAMPAEAECDPGSDLDCPLLPLQSRQVNPSVAHGEAAQTSISAGAPLGSVAINPMPLVSATSLDVSSSSETAAHAADRASRGDGPAPIQVPGADEEGSFVTPADVPTLDLRMRYQSNESADVTCGVQALGMALDGLDGKAPSSEAMRSFLQEQGMMYDFGTGVEELAYAAQSFGYKGSVPFHGATLADLRSELAAGRPAVVSLGANGRGSPGHFVTVTGISADGKWVAYSDPTLGKQVVPVEHFLRLWAQQGNSGVSVRKQMAGSPAAGSSPWVALAAGLMAMISTTPLGRMRQGIGGRLSRRSPRRSSRRRRSRRRSRRKRSSRRRSRPRRRSKPKRRRRSRARSSRRSKSRSRSRSRGRAKSRSKPARRRRMKPKSKPRRTRVSIPAKRVSRPRSKKKGLFGRIARRVASTAKRVRYGLSSLVRGARGMARDVTRSTSHARRVNLRPDRSAARALSSARRNRAVVGAPTWRSQTLPSPKRGGLFARARRAAANARRSVGKGLARMASRFASKRSRSSAGLRAFSGLITRARSAAKAAITRAHQAVRRAASHVRSRARKNANRLRSLAKRAFRGVRASFAGRASRVHRALGMGTKRLRRAVGQTFSSARGTWKRLRRSSSRALARANQALRATASRWRQAAIRASSAATGLAASARSSLTQAFSRVRQALGGGDRGLLGGLKDWATNFFKPSSSLGGVVRTATPEAPSAGPRAERAPIAPVAASTPTADEILKSIRAAREAEEARQEQLRLQEARQRLAEFERLHDECLDSDFPKGCMWELTEWVYDAYDVDLMEAAIEKQDNPLAGVSPELEQLAPNTLFSWIDHPERTVIIHELEMDVRESWNFEPVYFSKLKAAHPAAYEDALTKFRAREDEEDHWQLWIRDFEKYLGSYPPFSE